MADPKDVEATKAARREFSKRAVDISQADLRVMHGVVYLRGTVKAMRSGDGAMGGDLRSEIETIARVLRQKAGIRDVVIDVTYRG